MAQAARLGARRRLHAAFGRGAVQRVQQRDARAVLRCRCCACMRCFVPHAAINSRNSAFYGAGSGMTDTSRTLRCAEGQSADYIE